MTKYLFSLIALLVLTSNVSQASGCNPYDVVLTKESVVTDIGEFTANINCSNPKACVLAIYKESDYEYHQLLPQTSEKLVSKDLGTLKAHILKQAWASSCTEKTKYVIGVDVDGVRYRSEADLTYL